MVEGRRKLHVVERHHVEAAEDISKRRKERDEADAARLLRAGARKFRRVDDVEIDREIDGRTRREFELMEGI